MRIIFESQDKSVGVLIPTEEGISIFGIEGLAKKDIDLGLPFWIVEDEFIPNDRQFRGAWEIDRDILGEPQGYGEKDD